MDLSPHRKPDLQIAGEKKKKMKKEEEEDQAEEEEEAEEKQQQHKQQKEQLKSQTYLHKAFIDRIEKERFTVPVQMDILAAEVVCILQHQQFLGQVVLVGRRKICRVKLFLPAGTHKEGDVNQTIKQCKRFI